MSTLSPRQWMIEQRHLGYCLCLILDSEGEHETRQALIGAQNADHYCSVYSETPVAELASAGPFVFLIDNPDDRRLNALLDAPERNWGWLASLPPEAGLNALAKHWRDRLIVGARPYQALYRFHDNRVLTRALAHLTGGAVAGYLGPIASVCYWQGEHWLTLNNCAPGNHPVPERPAWCEVPVDGDQSARLRKVNANRYLLAEHLEAYARIAEQQDADLWLSTQLELAKSWGWRSPEQIEFLLTQSLTATNGALAERWRARANETPVTHFERIYQEVQFWQGGAPL